MLLSADVNPFCLSYETFFEPFPRLCENEGKHSKFESWDGLVKDLFG
jgi:hypothetical protein